MVCMNMQRAQLRSLITSDKTKVQLRHSFIYQIIINRQKLLYLWIREFVSHTDHKTDGLRTETGSKPSAE